jgi:hypothetical protein
MIQPTLFDEPAPDYKPEPTLHYQAHSETSRAAAESMRGSASSVRAKVLKLFRDRLPDGYIDEEIQNILGTNTVGTARVRRIELVAAGLVRDSGRKRATSSGRMAVVWEAVEAAR